MSIPNNINITQGFEDKRDLLTQMAYKRGNTLVSQRVYTHDVLKRPLSRQTSRNGQTVNDSFVHTYRSELASAQVNGQTYAYDYDNIGNRRMSIDASDYAFYDANELNQYSSIRKNEESAFVPTFDAAGNQTLVRTATGTWSVTYNAENRPVIFQKTADSVTTRITCTYDYMGRRATKKVEEITTDAEGNETTAIISNHRFIYRGYLQIACCDLTRSGHPCLWLITWDPTQPVATRPLAIQKDGTWYTYGWDLTKNICEIFGQNGYIRSTYAYTPFGSVTASGDVTQPIQWSSEYYDSELALVYYNNRHYNPTDGRWINRDPIAEQGGWNLYGFVGNSMHNIVDIKGNNRYITKYDPLHIYAGEFNFHVGVAVDLWTIRNGKYVKSGEMTYDFGPMLIEDTTLIAHAGNIINALLSVIIASGKVFNSYGITLDSYATIISSPCQDIAMLEYLEKERKNPPLYNLEFYNCIYWSLYAIMQGLDKPFIGCCNPDNSIYFPWDLMNINYE